MVESINNVQKSGILSTNSSKTSAEYMAKKTSIFGNNSTKEIKREVDRGNGNVQQREILVGKNADGKKIRVDAETLEELVSVETSGKNKYITKSEFDQLVRDTLKVSKLPAGMTAEFIHGQLVFKRGGDILTTRELRKDAGLIAQRIADEANSKPESSQANAEAFVMKEQLPEVKPIIVETPSAPVNSLGENASKAVYDADDKKEITQTPEAKPEQKSVQTPIPKTKAKPVQKSAKKSVSNTGAATSKGAELPAELRRPSDKPEIIKGTENPWGAKAERPKLDNAAMERARQTNRKKEALENGFKMGQAAKYGWQIDKKVMHEHIRNINKIGEGNVTAFLRSYDKGNGSAVIDIIKQLARYNTTSPTASKNAALKLLYGASKENKNDPALISVAQTIEKAPADWTEYARTADTVLYNILKRKQ